MNNSKWYIGCSGFAYKEWSGVFYPKGLPQTKWFQYYCEHFNTLEINSTFYRFPKIDALKSWYNKSPEGFLFSVKVPKFVTHYRQLRGEAGRMLGEFYNLISEGLAEKLGCVLFQMPKEFQYTEENLQIVTEQLSNKFCNTIEFRHQSWWNTTVQSQLKKNNIIFCSHSYPNLPDRIFVTGNIVYYRFHGVPVLYKSAYSKKFLKDVVNDISGFAEISFIYFNNTWGMSAIENAIYIQQFVKQKIIN